jgi:hypothetical protein
MGLARIDGWGGWIGSVWVLFERIFGDDQIVEAQRFSGALGVYDGSKIVSDTMYLKLVRKIIRKRLSSKENENQFPRKVENLQKDLVNTETYF